MVTKTLLFLAMFHDCSFLNFQSADSIYLKLERQYRSGRASNYKCIIYETAALTNLPMTGKTMEPIHIPAKRTCEKYTSISLLRICCVFGQAINNG